MKNDGASQRRAVFLDRDGVLNKAFVRDGKPFPPRSLAELEILPGVREGLERLQGRGFLLIGATNQPDVARGLQQREAVDAINDRVVSDLKLDDMRVCWHDDADGCECRKPKPGLLIDGAREHRISLPLSYMIGDRWRDVEAGQRAGCRTVWLRMGYAERGPTIPPDFTADRFDRVVEWILNDAGAHTGVRS